MVSKRKKSAELQTTEERLRAMENALLENRRAHAENKALFKENKAAHTINKAAHAANKASFASQKEDIKRLEKRLDSVELSLVYREAIRTTNFDKLSKNGKIAPGNKQTYLRRSKELCAWAHGALRTPNRPHPRWEKAEVVSTTSSKHPMYVKAKTSPNSFTNTGRVNASQYAKLVRARGNSAKYERVTDPPCARKNNGAPKKNK